MKQLLCQQKRIFTKYFPHLLVLIFITAFLIVSSSTGTYKRSNYRHLLLNNIQNAQSFSDFEDNLFRYEITGNSITTSYTLHKPQDKNIPYLEPLLTDFSYNYYNKDSKKGISQNIIRQLSDKLSSFDINALDEKDRITYELIDKHLKLNDSLCDYSYYETLLGKTTGAAANLPVTLSEYPLITENDIKTYLALLQQIPEYFDNVIKYEDRKTSIGIPTPIFLLNETDDELSHFIKSLKNDNNCFISTFHKRIMKIEGLSQKDRNKYISTNKYYTNQYIIPAYEKLQKYIHKRIKLTAFNNIKDHPKSTTLHSSQSKNSDHLPDINTSYGLSAFSGGKKYYELVIKESTGSERSVKEIISMTDEALSKTLYDILNIATTNTDAYMYYCDHTLETCFHTPEGILEALSLMIRKDYPTFNKPVTYDIKTVPDSLASMVSPAYYMIPAIDTYTDNTIYINPLYTSEQNGNLFTTLAHEGFPGHLYQTLYYNSTQPSPLRQILDYPGYVEGWATYVELNSYDFIDYANYPDCLPTLYRSESLVNLALSSRIDIGVNYENWTLNDTCKYLEELGFSSYYASDIYSYVVEAPGNYLSYFIGYLEIEDLKSEYMKLKADKYSDKDFHKALLDIGPADFETIRRHLIN